MLHKQSDFIAAGITDETLVVPKSIVAFMPFHLG